MLICRENFSLGWEKRLTAKLIEMVFKFKVEIKNIKLLHYKVYIHEKEHTTEGYTAKVLKTYW